MRTVRASPIDVRTRTAPRKRTYILVRDRWFGCRGLQWPRPTFSDCSNLILCDLLILREGLRRAHYLPGETSSTAFTWAKRSLSACWPPRNTRIRCTPRGRTSGHIEVTPAHRRVSAMNCAQCCRRWSNLQRHPQRIFPALFSTIAAERQSPMDGLSPVKDLHIPRTSVPASAYVANGTQGCATGAK